MAKTIIDQYTEATGSEELGLFELVVDEKSKQMNFQLAAWVVILAKHFGTLYGSEQGDLVTRQVISRCLTGNQTIH